MVSFFAARAGIGVHQRRKVFELRNQYTLVDEAGQPVGAVEQVGQSGFTVFARVVSSLDVALPVTLDVTDAQGQPVLRLSKPWFTMQVTLTEPTGRTLGTISRKIKLGKPLYVLADGSGGPAGEIRAKDWRSRHFSVVDPSGLEVAQVTKQWRGLFTEAFTDADSYAVTFSPAASADQRALAFAGALTVDLIQKQKDSS